MNIVARKVSDYLEVIVTDGSTTIDLGFHNAEEAKTLRDKLSAALDDFNWFISTQEK